ncbi:molybdopterin-containing oxidoreductase family protein [Anaeromyxobacter oryzae]|uniref:Nitrate reductase n=1 Tax=Anaeromyxobacter oryzae TaxID=2918170 RepID=A0ABN6MYI5_9BACT|nr:molybdopterin-dependent oxidoreductase [Anaeromyxobacter oryzae]BDG06039.1 nitrate reductase [Anaeromyxobacter oryzae]
MAITRRKFIQIGAAGAGGAAVASGLGTRWWGLDRDPVPDPGTDGDRVVASYCELCFWGCGVLAHVKDGRVTKITGNPEHPLSRGMLCPRGAGATGLLYDPDRLRRPLVRRAKRGEDVFEEVSWDAALNETGEKLLQVKARHGAEAVALFTHGSGGVWFKHFMKAWGSPNVGAPSYAQCRGPREAAFTLTFGTPLGSPEPIDLANARCITLIGSHLGENMHNTQVQELAEAIGKGAGLVVVDPRFSVAASKAKFWLPVKPGTDIALLLAWMNVLVAEKLYDAEYVARYAEGFDALAAHVADKTPEWAYAITGVRPELIRASARFIGGARPASLVHPGRHTVWYGDDTQRERAMAILAALLGSWGRRGGYLTASKFPVPAYPLPADLPHAPAKDPTDKPKAGGYPLATEVLASGLCDATKPGHALYDLKAWIVYGCNLLQAMPNRKELLDTIQNLEFMVAIDVLPAEVTGWADVVLPESTYLERDDDVSAPPYKRPFVALRQAAVEPMYDSRPGWWIAKALAEHVGLGGWFPWKDAKEYVRTRLAQKGLPYDELAAKGVLLGPAAPTCEEEGAPVGAATENGKIQLFSKELAQLGFDPLPVYVPQDEGPPGHFRLLSGRAPLHTFGRTVNNRLLAEPFPENEVWLNADAARSLPGFELRPLENGERVVLVNQDGIRSTPVKVKLTQRIRGDCVYLVHGWGQTARRLRYAHGRGASDSLLTSRYKVDPIMGGTGMNVNFVRLERAGEAA